MLGTLSPNYLLIPQSMGVRNPRENWFEKIDASLSQSVLDTAGPLAFTQRGPSLPGLTASGSLCTAPPP